LKILQLISAHQWTGPTDYVITLAKYLQDKGFDSMIGFRSFHKGSLKRHFIENSINFTEDLKFPKGFHPILLFRDIFGLFKIVKDFTPDIIHCHNDIENILAVFIKKFSGASYKVVRSIHNEKFMKRKIFSSFLLNFNDYIITNCSEYRDLLLSFMEIPSHKLEVIKGFVDKNKFCGESRRSNFFIKNYGIGDEYIKIGMVARFQESRGHKYLIDAFQSLKRLGYNNIKLILVGRGEVLDSLKIYVKKLGIDSDVVWTGYVRENLPELLHGLDIFVLLNRGSDGSCRAILEAMASGLPVVGVRRGSFIDTIIEDKNGFFIYSKSNVPMLAEKLKILIDNKELRLKMGEESLKIVDSEFSKDKQVEKYLLFYKKIMGYSDTTS